MCFHDTPAVGFVVAPFAIVFHPVDDRCCAGFVVYVERAVEVDWGAEGSAAGAFAESVKVASVVTAVGVFRLVCPGPDF